LAAIDRIVIPAMVGMASSHWVFRYGPPGDGLKHSIHRQVDGRARVLWGGSSCLQGIVTTSTPGLGRSFLEPIAAAGASGACLGLDAGLAKLDLGNGTAEAGACAGSGGSSPWAALEALQVPNGTNKP
jgi:hypothetical protein